MDGWITPLQKIVLTIVLGTAVGGILLASIFDWADTNKDRITDPDYRVHQIERSIDEVMA